MNKWMDSLNSCPGTSLVLEFLSLLPEKLDESNQRAFEFVGLRMAELSKVGYKSYKSLVYELLLILWQGQGWIN
jgi:hypothetical protein